VADKMTSDHLVYGVPLRELPALYDVLEMGVAWARSNGLPLPSKTVERVRDLETTVAAMRPIRPVAPEVAPPSGGRLHAANVSVMGGCSSKEAVSPAVAGRVLGRSRWAVTKRLHAGTLDGWQDQSGYWHVPIAALEDTKTKGA
jgi:hypothetical protein